MHLDNETSVDIEISLLITIKSRNILHIGYALSHAICFDERQTKTTINNSV